MFLLWWLFCNAWSCITWLYFWEVVTLIILSEYSILSLSYKMKSCICNKNPNDISINATYFSMLYALSKVKLLLFKLRVIVQFCLESAPHAWLFFTEESLQQRICMTVSLSPDWHIFVLLCSLHRKETPLLFRYIYDVLSDPYLQM